MPRVKIGVSRQIVIPKKIYDALGLNPGDYLDIKLYQKRLLITPKEFKDKRPEIDKRLAMGEEDVKAGRVSGPFKTVAEVARHLNAIK